MIKEMDFITGVRTVATFGDALSQTGGAISYYIWEKTDNNLFHYNADAEVLIIPLSGRFLLKTECGNLELDNSEIGVVPKGMKWSVVLQNKECKGYLCENYGAPLDLPERGLIGSDCLANSRDFISPIAAYEENVGPSKLIAKLAGRFYEMELPDSPLDVLGWVGNSPPYKYDLRRFNAINTVTYDHPDPSIFTVMTSSSDSVGTANLDFVIFPPRWMVATDTFRPPWFHRNCMSEYMGLLSGSYDAKPDGFLPGGMSIHNTFTPHGPDVNAHKMASAAELKPEEPAHGIAFMLESRYTMLPTKFAMSSKALQKDYYSCWEGFTKSKL